MIMLEWLFLGNGIELVACPIHQSDMRELWKEIKLLKKGSISILFLFFSEETLKRVSPVHARAWSCKHVLPLLTSKSSSSSSSACTGNGGNTGDKCRQLSSTVLCAFFLSRPSDNNERKRHNILVPWRRIRNAHKWKGMKEKEEREKEERESWKRRDVKEGLEYGLPEIQDFYTVNMHYSYLTSFPFGMCTHISALVAQMRDHLGNNDTLLPLSIYLRLFLFYTSHDDCSHVVFLPIKLHLYRHWMIVAIHHDNDRWPLNPERHRKLDPLQLEWQ